MECERDWSVGLGATLCDGQKIKNYFSSLRDISGKADSVILLGIECTISQAWPLGASYSQSNQQETEQSTVHCIMLSA